MADRKRPIVLRCPVTAEERELIEQKMAQLHTKRIGGFVLVWRLIVAAVYVPVTMYRLIAG